MFRLIRLFQLRAAMIAAAADFESYMNRPAGSGWNIDTANQLQRAKKRTAARYLNAMEA